MKDQRTISIKPVPPSPFTYGPAVAVNVYPNDKRQRWVVRYREPFVAELHVGDAVVEVTVRVKASS